MCKMVLEKGTVYHIDLTNIPRYKTNLACNMILFIFFIARKPIRAQQRFVCTGNGRYG